MPHLPVIANTFRVSLEWSGAGLNFANVMHFVDNSGTKVAADIFGILDAEVETNMFDVTRSSVVVDTVKIIKLDGTSATEVFPTGRPAKWGGGQTGGDFQVAPSYLISLRTGLRGQANRGRIYLPAPADSAQADGLVNAGNQATLQAAWDDFRVDVAVDGIEMTVASYRHAVQHPVTATIAELPLATQRRRQKQLRH